MHKAGKANIVLDTLLQLASNTIVVPIDLELDFAFANIATMYNYMAIMAKMSENFKQKLLNGYITDPVYICILETIKSNNVLREDIASLPFALQDNLIWHIDQDGFQRLCIPELVILDILQIVHTDARHPREAKTAKHAGY